MTADKAIKVCTEAINEQITLLNSINPLVETTHFEHEAAIFQEMRKLKDRIVSNHISDLARKIRNADNWLDVLDEVTELCEYAGLAEEWENADGDTFESVVNHAAEILNVNI